MYERGLAVFVLRNWGFVSGCLLGQLSLTECNLKRLTMISLIFDTSAPLSKIILSDQQIYKRAELHRKAKEHLEQLFGCGSFDFYLLHNGKILAENVVEGDVYVIPRLRGGKGGFGSMLRAIGAQIEKTTNREACRDLSGRRLRDINEEKRLKKWIAEQAEREQEALERKKRKLEKLKKEIKHEFNDEEYTKSRLEMPDNIHEAVEQGLQAATEEPTTSEEPVKSKTQQNAKKPNKKKAKGKLWVDDLLEDSEASDLDSETSEVDESKEPEKKKMKLS